MADILLDKQGKPTAPAAGQAITFVDNQSSTLCTLDDAGKVKGSDHRASIAQASGFAADTYLANSGLVIPSCGMQPGMVFEWDIVASKTAAGVAAPAYKVRIGAAQTVADTARLTLNGPLQTAAADIAIIRIAVTVRSVNAAGVIQGHVRLQHNLAATGFADTGPAGLSIVEGTSAAFDNSALGGQFAGLSIDAGAAAAWTIEQVTARIRY
jgi:hypothetical protein